MNLRQCLRVTWPLLLLTTACRSSAAPPATAGEGERARAVERAAQTCLDELHRSAGLADGEAYFALFAPDGVYLGTDASERWTIAEFRAYAEPYFARGQGWTYNVRERHLALSEDLRTVWFDERLDNASYGECRGSGVLIERDGRYLIAQYVLSLPVPNSLARDLVERIRALEPESGGAPTDGGL